MKKLLIILFIVPFVLLGQSSEKLYKKGLEKYENKDIQGACECWVEASSFWPKNSDWSVRSIFSLVDLCDNTKYAKAPSFKLEQFLPQSLSNIKYERFRKVSLTDLEGKYLFIDFWATWCSPCIKEQPYLKKLEENYRGKNIEFVSISVDDKEDYEKWKKMVNDKNLPGIQLISGEGWGSLANSYGVNGIPTFVLISPNGNILSWSAYRPSNEEIYDILDDLLQS